MKCTLNVTGPNIVNMPIFRCSGKKGSNSRKSFRPILTGTIAALFLISLSPLFAAGRSEEKTPSVAVSILPMKYFVDRISGGEIDVTVLVPPGKSPATYEPTPRQVTDLSAAEVLFTIGVPFELSFIPIIASTLPDLEIVDTTTGIEKREIDGDEHEESDGHDEHSDLPDPHVWLSPPLVKIQARNILQALIEAYPAQEDSFSHNYRALLDDLDALHRRLKESLAPVKGSSILVYHPSFGYFAEEYGLHQIAVELGGKEPTPKKLEQVIARAREEGVKVIFVQPEFSRTSAERVADAIGGAVVEVAPLKPDYLENMYEIAAKIEAGILR